MISRKRLATVMFGLLLLSFVSAWPSSASSSGIGSDKFDDQIKAAVKTYWPDLPPWRLWRAQLFQESRLDPAAVSPVGARGLAQIMPGTAADLALQLGYGKGTSPHDVKFAINAGAFYMAKLRRAWHRDRQPLDQHWLAVPSYNAGTGTILKAQKLCADAKLWDQISPCLGAVSGAQFSRETTTYVIRIRQYWAAMEAQ